MFLLVLPIAIVGCNGREGEVPVSGPAYCQSFDAKAVESRAMGGNVEAMRQMRDYCFDCRVTPDGAEILRWAEMAAKHGDESDLKALNDIRETFSND